MRVKMTVMAALATLASSVGLYPLFASGTWFWSGLGSVIVVAGAGLLMRRLRAPSVLGALGGLGALHLYLNARFASGQALLGVIPTPDSIRRLGTLMGDGWNAANQYAAPVPLVPGIELLAATGIGLVAVVVDLLAVRLRRSAPAGLPLLAMYSVPAAVREDSVSWLAFGLGALGFLMLLMADAREQVGGWGRAVFTRRWSADTAEPPAERPDSSGMAASGRRIGVAAVAVAVLLPTVIPGIHPRGMFGMGGDGDGGSQTVTTVEPLAQLKRDLNGKNRQAVIFTYQTDDTERPDYLRMYALDKFEGDRWTYSALPSSSQDRVSGRDLPTPPGLSTARFREVVTRIKIRRAVKKVDFLPAPYAPRRVSIKGDWRAHPQSLMVYSLRDSASGRSYTVSSLRVQPAAAELARARKYPSDILTPYTVLPRSIPPQVRTLAETVTKGATTAYDQAVRLQRWFTQSGEFAYDLDPPPPSSAGDLADFLLRTKRGYCEQFAASMAVMARILGIPARVAIGYTAGTQIGQREWEVRSKDAHAWPELYFEGAGWVRFEPTPAGLGGQGTAATPPYTQQSSERPSEQPTDNPTPEASSPASQGPNATEGPSRRPDDAGADPGIGKKESDGTSIPVGWLAGGLLVLMLLAAPMAVRLLTRRRR
ncbi:transglutaminaseTgpA domain-containing protein, partial [Actinomadura fulvescens]